MNPQALEEPGVAAPDRRALRYVRWFDQIGIDDVPLVGGKNASLGEMYRKLASAGVKVPNGFAITAEAYRYFLRETGVDAQIKEILRELDTGDIENLRSRGTRVRHAIMSAEIPADLEQAIAEAYAELSADAAHPLDVAVRSSATAEDLPDASFAGQQETYLNVQGRDALLHTCRRCFASLFTDRAISYRADKGFDHHKIALSIGVQRMVRADLGASGVMFTIDTETGFRDAILINAAYGLGENIVQGSINPDEYYVFKPTLRDGHRPILQKTLGTKEFKLIYDVGGGKRVKNVPVPPHERGRFAISDDEILTARAVGLHHRRPLQQKTRALDADGYRVGEGRTDRRVVYPPGAARDGAIAQGHGHHRDLPSQIPRACPDHRAQRWRKDRRRPGACD